MEIKQRLRNAVRTPFSPVYRLPTILDCIKGFEVNLGRFYSVGANIYPKTLTDNAKNCSQIVHAGIASL